MPLLLLFCCRFDGNLACLVLDHKLILDFDCAVRVWGEDWLLNVGFIGRVIVSGGVHATKLFCARFQAFDGGQRLVLVDLSCLLQNLLGPHRHTLGNPPGQIFIHPLLWFIMKLSVNFLQSMRLHILKITAVILLKLLHRLISFVKGVIRVILTNLVQLFGRVEIFKIILKVMDAVDCL